MHDVDIGTVVNLDKILLVGSKAGTLIGQPLVSGAKVRFLKFHSLFYMSLITTF
jgi:ribosomal protein L21